MQRSTHDGSITCLAGYLSSDENSTEGGLCALGYLTDSNTCSECDLANGWTRLHGRQMCVKCFTKIQMAIAAVSGVLFLVLFVLVLRCAKMDAPPKGSSMNRHALRNMLAIQSRSENGPQTSAEKVRRGVRYLLL